MFDKELVREILGQVLESAQIVLQRFKGINSADDFTKDPAGLEKLDAICMNSLPLAKASRTLISRPTIPYWPNISRSNGKKQWVCGTLSLIIILIWMQRLSITFV